MSDHPTLTQQQRELLIQGAFRAIKGSYSPYSKFRVGAALLTEDDKIILGANIENASYGEYTSLHHISRWISGASILF